MGIKNMRVREGYCLLGLTMSGADLSSESITIRKIKSLDQIHCVTATSTNALAAADKRATIAPATAAIKCTRVNLILVLVVALLYFVDYVTLFSSTMSSSRKTGGWQGIDHRMPEIRGFRLSEEENISICVSVAVSRCKFRLWICSCKGDVRSQSVLANEPAAVKSEQYIVEFKPQVRMTVKLANMAFDLRPTKDVLLWPGNANMAFDLRPTEDVLPWPGNANMAFDLRPTEDVLPWPGHEKATVKYKASAILIMHLDKKVVALHLEKLGSKLTKLTQDQSYYLSIPIEEGKASGCGAEMDDEFGFATPFSLRLDAKTIEHTTSLIAQNAEFKAQLQEKGFEIAALKNELRKLKGNSVNTKFAKSSILGESIFHPLRNQFVVRQPTVFKSERPKSSKPRFASQVDVNNDLLKPVTTHYLPREREFAFAKSHHMIAPSSSRWVSTGMIFTSSTTMVDSEPPHGSNTNITNLHECIQTLDSSAGTSINVQEEQNLNLSACTPSNLKKERIKACIKENVICGRPRLHGTTLIQEMSARPKFQGIRCLLTP
ncbi:actin-binding, cofilin/tropomyosin type protein [Tanacetum coccineum]